MPIYKIKPANRHILCKKITIEKALSSIEQLHPREELLMKLEKLKTNKKGFTLIELMIVIAIIGILAAVAIPNFISYRDKAYCSAAEQDAKSIAAAIADYFAIPSHTQLIPQLLYLQEIGGPGFNGGPALMMGSSTSSPNFSPLSGLNIATIMAPASSTNIRITVKDGSQRCPEDYMEAQAGAGWDKDTGEFTKKIE